MKPRKNNPAWARCLKCQKDSYHKSGLCNDCRIKTCAKCSRVFTPYIPNQKTCKRCPTLTHHANKRDLSNHTNNTSNYILA